MRARRLEVAGMGWHGLRETAAVRPGLVAPGRARRRCVLLAAVASHPREAALGPRAGGVRVGCDRPPHGQRWDGMVR